jgi:hypothetical protein
LEQETQTNNTDYDISTHPLNMQKSEVYNVIKNANEGNEDVGVGEAQCDDDGE